MSHTSLQLTTTQRALTRALVELSRGVATPITGDDLAAAVGKKASTVRNLMRSLKELGLVESTYGPNGGYRPTPLAVELFAVEAPIETEIRPAAEELSAPEGSAVKVDILDFHEPARTRVVIHLRESAEEYEAGDELVIGPLPSSELSLHVRVIETDTATNVVYARVVAIQLSVSTGEE
ncbi:Rrf2 family transcriptional regulator [Natronomonas sp. EA1]|uniref:Rrf2 family transcriptional regulator n=1 Tax=Natronomonas sp. EA1 TaxID=3421655 RepID=UPI003EBA6C62